MNRFSLLWATLCATWLSVPFVSAEMMLDVGTYNVAPESTFVLTLAITGDPGDDIPILGMNFNLVSGDGGPELGLGGTLGPRITAINIIDGTIFDGNNTGQTEIARFPQAIQLSTTTETGAVSALGQLATITVSTQGLTVGQSFDLLLNSGLTGPTELLFDAGNGQVGVAPVRITNGRINIQAIPEPGSVAMLALLGSVVSLRRRKYCKYCLR